jgi:hypothetical protein
MLIAHLRPQAKTPPLSKPNFSARAKLVVDKATGEKRVYREITVTTHLVDPAEVERVPTEPDSKK